jgi:hypothetical protein
MVDPARYYTIAELTKLIGGSDRLYRGEISEGRLDAIFTGEWRILGADALSWAAARAERRRNRRPGNPPVTLNANRLPSLKGGADSPAVR